MGESLSVKPSCLTSSDSDRRLKLSWDLRLGELDEEEYRGRGWHASDYIHTIII